MADDLPGHVTQEGRHTDPAYRSELGTYYGGFVHGRPGGPDYGLGDRPTSNAF